MIAARILFMTATFSLIAVLAGASYGEGDNGRPSGGPEPALILQTTMPIPGIDRTVQSAERLFSFGDGTVDSTRALYLLSDRNAASVDIFDLKRLRLIRQIAAGNCRLCHFSGVDGSLSLSKSGPNAIALIDGTPDAWVGDVGSIKLVNYVTGRILRSLAIESDRGTVSLYRSSHACYAAARHVLMVINPDDPTPFVTFVDTHQGKILRRIDFTNSLGFGDCAYRSVNQTFFLAETGSPRQQLGALLSIRLEDILSGAKAPAISTYASNGCSPEGMAFEAKQRYLMVGCGAIASPTPVYDSKTERIGLETALFDAKSGRYEAPLLQVGGAGAIAFDRRLNRWYVAASHMTSNSFPDGDPSPVLGIIRAPKGRWIENVPTGDLANSVAVDARTGLVFVPVRETAVSDGGVMVFRPH